MEGGIQVILDSAGMIEVLEFQSLVMRVDLIKSACSAALAVR
jgi:hypothetical protein